MNILLIFLISAFSCFGQAFTFNDIAFLNSASQNNPADNKVVTSASPLVLDAGGNYFFTNIIVKGFGYIKINNRTIQYPNPTRWTCIICSNLTMEANATFSPNYFNNNEMSYQGDPITATAPDSYPLSYLYPDGNNSSGEGGGWGNGPYPFGYPSSFGGGGGRGWSSDAEFGLGSEAIRGGNGGIGYDGGGYYTPGGGGGNPGGDNGPPNAGGDAGNYFIVGSIFGSYGAGGGGGGQGYSGGLVYLKVLSTINFSTGSSFNFNGQDGGNGGHGGNSAILPDGLTSGIISYGGCGGGGGGAGDGGVLILRYYSIANNNATYNFKAGNPGNPGAGGYGQSGISTIPNGIPGNSGLPANDGMISLIKMK
jgi:hypothetical protein